MADSIPLTPFHLLQIQHSIARVELALEQQRRVVDQILAQLVPYDQWPQYQLDLQAGVLQRIPEPPPREGLPDLRAVEEDSGEHPDH